MGNLEKILTVVLVVSIAALIVVPTVILEPPVANRAEAEEAEEAEYVLQYLPEDVDVALVQHLAPEDLERALNEVKKTRTVRSVIPTGDSYVLLLERAKYLP